MVRSSRAEPGPAIGKYASAPTPVSQPLGRAGLVGAGQRLQREVGVLEQQPAAGPERRGHRGEGRATIREVHHHQARVDQVEPGSRRGLGRDVVPQDLEARFRCLRQRRYLAYLLQRRHVGCFLQRRHVDVGSQHVAAGRDSPGQPGRHGRAARADLPAPPARPDAECVHAPERRGVEQVGQAGVVGPGYPLPHALVPALLAGALLIRHATALPQNR